MPEWNQRLIAFVRERDRYLAGSILAAETRTWDDAKSFSVLVTDLEGETWFGCFSACHEELREAIAANLSKAKLPAQFVILQGFLANPTTQQYSDLWAVVRSSNQMILHQNWTLEEAFDLALQAFNLQRAEINVDGQSDQTSSGINNFK